MQVVILCGGQGTRIRDVTEDLPKPMLAIGARPILWHIMKSYAAHGCKHFILCLGYKSWIIKRYFLDYHLQDSNFTVNLGAAGEIKVHHSPSGEDWRVTLVETGLDAMTGCRVKRVERYITGDHFHLTYGDGLADVDVGRLAQFHHQHGKIGTVTVVQPPGRFGEVDLDGSRVVEFMEKPLLARGRISGGFFVFHRRVFRFLTDDPGLILENDPLRRLVDAGELMAYRHDGFWHAMDNSRDYKFLNDLWAAGNAPWTIPWQQPLLRAA